MLEPTTTLKAAASGAGVKAVRYNSAHSAGCPCCPDHGEDCPGSPKNGHIVPHGVTPCEGRCRTGFRVCPRANSAWEEFCVFNPARIDHIEIIDGPEELIGFGKEFWDKDPHLCGAAVRDKLAQLEAEAKIARAAVDIAVKQQRENVLAVAVKGVPVWLTKMNGVYERVEGDGELLKNGDGYCLFFHTGSSRWRISSTDDRTSNRCLAHMGQVPLVIPGCIPSGLIQWEAWNGEDWVLISIDVQLYGADDEIEEMRQQEKRAQEELLARCAACAQSQLCETAAVLVSGCPAIRESNGIFYQRESYKGWPCFEKGSIYIFYHLRQMEWQIGRFVPEKTYYDTVRLSSESGELPTGNNTWHVYDHAKKQHVTCSVTTQLMNADEVDCESQEFEAQKQKCLSAALAQLGPVGAVVVSDCPNELWNGTYQRISSLARMSTPTPGWLRPRVRQGAWPCFENQHGYQLFNYHNKATSATSTSPILQWQISPRLCTLGSAANALVKSEGDCVVHATIDNSGGAFDDKLVEDLNTLITGRGVAVQLRMGDDVEIALRDVFRAMLVRDGQSGFASSKAHAIEIRRQFGELQGYEILRSFLAEEATPCAFAGAAKVCAQSTITNWGPSKSNKDRVREAGLLPLLGRYLHRIPMTAKPLTALPRQPTIETLLLESASAIANCVGNIPNHKNVELVGQLGYLEALVEVLRLYDGASTDSQKLRFKAVLALKLCCRKDMLANCARLLRMEDIDGLICAEAFCGGATHSSPEMEKQMLQASEHLREALKMAAKDPSYASASAALADDAVECGVHAEFLLHGHPLAALNGKYTEQGSWNGCPLFRQVEGPGALYKWLAPTKSPKWNFIREYSVEAAKRGLVYAAIGGEDDYPPGGCRVWRWCPPKDFVESAKFAELGLPTSWQDVELTLATTPAQALIRAAYDDVINETRELRSCLAPGHLPVGAATWQCYQDGKWSPVAIKTALLSHDEAQAAAIEIAKSQEVYCEATLANARKQLCHVAALEISGTGIEKIDGDIFVPTQQESRGMCFENAHGRFLYNYCPTQWYPAYWRIGPELGVNTCTLYHTPAHEDYTLPIFLKLCKLSDWHAFIAKLPRIKTAQHLRSTPAMELQRAISNEDLEPRLRLWARRAGCTEVRKQVNPQSVEGEYRCHSGIRSLTARVDVDSDGSVALVCQRSGKPFGEGRLTSASTFVCKAYEHNFTVERVPKGLQFTAEGDTQLPQCYVVSSCGEGTTVHREFDEQSEQVKRLSAGEVVVTLETRSDGQQDRVRLASGGWASVATDGNIALEQAGNIADMWVSIPRHVSTWPDIGEKLATAVRDGPTCPASGGGELPVGATVWFKTKSGSQGWSEARVTVKVLSEQERDDRRAKQREHRRATLLLHRKHALDQVVAMKATGIHVSGFPSKSVYSPVLDVTLDLASFNGKYVHTDGHVTHLGFPVWHLDGATSANQRFMYRPEWDSDSCVCFNTELAFKGSVNWAHPHNYDGGAAAPLGVTKWSLFTGEDGKKFSTVELMLASSAIPSEIAAAGVAAVVSLLSQHSADRTLSGAAMSRLKELLTLKDDEACTANAKAAGAAGGCASVVGWLQDHLEDAEAASLACSTLYNLAFKIPDNRAAIDKHGGPLAIVAALDIHRGLKLREGSQDVVTHGCKALGELGRDSPAICAAISAADGHLLLVAALKHYAGELSIVTRIIDTLILLCDHGRDAQLRPAIAVADGAEAVMAAIRWRRYDAKLQYDGLLLLFKLTDTAAGLARVRRAGAGIGAKMALGRHSSDSRLARLANQLLQVLQ
eukprot:COSAG01_NODE_120_length_25409_cov_20.648572_2_plen_1795_part_00